jgi:hypothetical protein
MGMQDFFTAISNFGFPVVVTGYLLLRFEKKIDKLEEAIEQLTQKIDNLIIRKR